jgi:hypothetical protein
MNPRTPIRHGEVLLLPIPAAPEGRTETVARCVVGHSESGPNWTFIISISRP